MKSIGKILGLTFLGLLLIVIGLGFALTHLFDPNDYKDEIQQLARDKANLELKLNGDIGWSLFPWLGLELTDATLASAATPDKPFADLRLLGFSVRVLPLLRKEVQMSDIRIDGLNLTLQRDDKGHGNWEQIGKPAKTSDAAATSPADTASAEPTAQAPAERSDTPLKLDIDSLTVSNSRIDYHDARSGKQFGAEGIELTTGAIREGASIPLKLTAYLAANQPLLRAKTNLQTQLRFDRALKRYQLEDLKLSGEVSGEPLKGKTLTFATEGQLLLDQAAQIAEWTGLKLSANQLRALGELKLRNLDQAAQLEGNLSVAQVNLREFLTGVGVELPPMRDATSLGQFELSSRLAGSPNSLAFNDLALKLDGSSLSGSLAISDFAKQALRVQLKGDTFNVDRYLPPQDKDASAGVARKNEVKQAVAAAGKNGNSELPSTPSQQAWSDKPMLPLEQLRKLDVQADLSFGQLTLSKLPIESAKLQATGKDGVLNLQELRGDLYGGEFSAKAQLDARPAIPLLTAQKRISRIPVEKLLEAQGEKPPVKGLLDLNADIRTQGNSQKAWIDALNGKADFSLSDGALLDANLEQQLCQGIATLNRKSLSSEPRGKDTPFEELHGSLTFHNGVASNPDLKARLPGLAVSGDGDVDLRVLGMDYRVGITLEGDQRAMPDPACQVNQRYVDIEWPLRCRGPLELGAKACRLDKDGMTKVASKLAGSKLEEKIEEKLGDKVSPELKEALKGLFKR
ncbi:AsmA family protein [Aquipseudomonas ullengensis]|uniref:AsmA family protein n=1 Tax=Aquipseudomonas ullengensis TaxID=2759166 RepID=A0A7W4LPB6_9GAMM|nr:AsmA family protein [Pseudomonas ullengensis]MBB2496828.1 AsmA family protein [Pseudomonas ullengensis]